MSFDLLQQVDEAVFSMERAGVLVDADFCGRTAEVAADDEMAAWEDLSTWVASTGLEPTDVLGRPLRIRDAEDDSRAGESGVRLREMLHDRLGLPPSPFWKKGAVKEGEVKLDATAIAWLAGHVPEHRADLRRLLDLRRARGCLKYLRKLPRFANPHTGRVHCVFGPASDEDERVGALTGRLAVKKPELQQIPRDARKDVYGIRQAFVAGPGNSLLCVDYTALEVVIFAHLTKALFGMDDMVAAVQPGAPDIHSVHALGVFRDHLGVDFLGGVQPDQVKKHADPRVQQCRDDIKSIFYGLNYGKGTWGFGNTLFDADGNALGEKRAGAMLDGLFAFRPGIPAFHEWVRDYIRRRLGIPSLAGRWCDLSDLLSGRPTDWALNRAWRRALNFPMQAGGADIIGRAMWLVASCPRLAALGWRLICQIHDELMLEGPTESAEEAKMLVNGHMVGAWRLHAPLRATGKYGPSWAACK